jgi:hypothetical protein
MFMRKDNFLHLTGLCMNTDAWHHHWYAQDSYGVLQCRVMAVMSTVAVIKPLRLLLMEYGRPAQLVVGLSSLMASMEIWCAHPTMSCVTVLFHTFQEHVLMPATSMESVSMGSATVFWALVVNIAINVSLFISGCHLYHNLEDQISLCLLTALLLHCIQLCSLSSP